jgi:hypothetical protein
MPCSVVDQCHSVCVGGGSSLLYSTGTQLPDCMTSSRTRRPYFWKVCAQEYVIQPTHEPVPSCRTSSLSLWRPQFVSWYPKRFCCMTFPFIFHFCCACYIPTLYHLADLIPIAISGEEYKPWGCWLYRFLLFCHFLPCLSKHSPRQRVLKHTLYVYVCVCVCVYIYIYFFFWVFGQVSDCYKN